MIYILIKGGMIYEIVTDDPKLINTPITIVDADYCDPRHLIKLGNTTYAATVRPQMEQLQLVKVTVKPNPEYET